MPQRRILSLWLPRLAAERVLRREPALAEAPFAVVEETGGLLRLSALNGVAAGEGLSRGMPLTDARAICPALLTRPADPVAEGGMRAALLRWAGRFSPWVAEDAAGPGQAALVLDITGAAHLFGGEAALAEQVEGEAAALGLTARAAIADTRGAAWALARFAGAAPAAARSGDAIDQEAHATRVRAAKRRHWEKGGAAPAAQAGAARVPRIAAPGATRRALAPLPVAALRLEPAAVTQLTRLGLRRVEDLAGLPRGAVARRFGADVLRRLDQALGAEPEPVSPARLAPRPAARLTLPEPVGLRSDIEAGLDRLLAALEPRLEAAGLGARRLRLTLTRVDGTAAHVELGLARPGREAARIAPLFGPKLDGIDAGFGIERLRLAAIAVEPLAPVQHRGHLAAAAEARAREGAGGGEAFADLLGRIGARVGLEALTRPLPAESHIPEKSVITAAAAFTEATPDWPRRTPPRPVTLFAPEPVTAEAPGRPPATFRWRRQSHRTARAEGPERIAPEWWLDDPAWRDGPRDYWRIETEEGRRLWLYTTPTPAWFVHGELG